MCLYFLVVFCPIKRLPSKTDGRKKKSDPRQGSTTFFFFGTDKGVRKLSYIQILIHKLICICVNKKL